MFRKSLSLIAIAAFLANAADVSTRLSSTTKVSCSTLSGSGGDAPTPIPTTTKTNVHSQTTTLAASTATAYDITTDGTVTTTELTQTSVSVIIATVHSPTYTTDKIIYSVFATATIPTTVCINNVKPKTITKYTGTYSPVSGQQTNPPQTYPTQVVCQADVTTIVNVIPIKTKTETVHRTVTSTVSKSTTTTISTLTYATALVYDNTVTTTTTSYTVNANIATIKTACESTVTTTYDARCAPTNIIGAINGGGLVSNTYAKNIAVTYGNGNSIDASLCCQLCLDNKSCAGSMMGPGIDSVCGLLYVGSANGPVCDVHAFNYGTQDDVAAGQGLLVQAGCDTITYSPN